MMRPASRASAKRSMGGEASPSYSRWQSHSTVFSPGLSLDFTSLIGHLQRCAVRASWRCTRLTDERLAALGKPVLMIRSQARSCQDLEALDVGDEPGALGPPARRHPGAGGEGAG